MNKKTKAVKAPMPPKEDKLVRITFDAPASLRKAVKLKAAQQERSLKEVICELMQSYLSADD